VQANHRDIPNLLNLSLGRSAPEQLRDDFHIEPQSAGFAHHPGSKIRVTGSSEDHLVGKRGPGDPCEIAGAAENSFVEGGFIIEKATYDSSCVRMSFEIRRDSAPDAIGSNNEHLAYVSTTGTWVETRSLPSPSGERIKVQEAGSDD
jgi:hypothetical protein